MLTRRQLLASAAASAFFNSAGPVFAQAQGNLKAAAQARGVDVGAFATLSQLNRPDIGKVIADNFTLAAILFDEMEWDANPGNKADPVFFGLSNYLNAATQMGLNVRARQIYSHEALPPNAHLREDGTPKNKSELESTLLKRVEQVCKPLKGRTNITVQVIDEILDPRGGLRKDPFSKALGEEYVDLLFHATRDQLPDVPLIYFDSGPEVDPDNYFKKFTKDYLKLLERLRKRNVPVTGVALGGFVYPPGHAPFLRKPLFKAIEDLDYDIHWAELTTVYTDGGNGRWKPKTPEAEDKVVQEKYVEVFEFLGELKRLREITFFAPIDTLNTIETGTLGMPPIKGARPGLFNKDLTPKPVYDAVPQAMWKAKATS